MAERERLAELQADVDARLVDLWLIIWRGRALRSALEDEATRRVFADCLRTAYALGYREALDEDSEGRRGELHATHGYAIP
jgi:hypothetical protein